MSVNNFINLGGWVDDKKQVETVLSQLPIKFLHVVGGMKDSGKGKIVCLYRNVIKVTGGFIVFYQTIGDCVSMGMAQAINVLACTEIVQGELESWDASAATEPLYANGRILIGRGQLGYSDGSIGAWQAQAAQKYGFNVRKKYGNYDLSVYSGQRAKDWGNPGKGTPKELLEISKNNLVKEFTQVRNYEEARDAICSGYPVTVASNVGFTSVRDKAGCLRRSGSWAHQMMFAASFDDGKDPALLCVNSWGPDWVTGPQKFGDEPKGSFWVRASDVNVMLAANDSFCYSALDGFPVRKLNLRKLAGG